MKPTLRPIDPGVLPPWTERFWSKVDKGGPIPTHRPELGPCWTWTASTNADGYGQFAIAHRPHRPHRLAYELIVGLIPDGLQLDHLCRVRCCVRPSHLEPVTNGENIRRARALMRRCVNGHERTPENTYIRPDGRAHGCLVCRTEASARHEARRSAA